MYPKLQTFSRRVDRSRRLLVDIHQFVVFQGMTVGDLKLVDGSVLTLQRQQSGGLQNKPDSPLWLVLFVRSAVHCFNLPTFDGRLQENYDSYCHSQLLHLFFWMFISILTEMMKVLKWVCKSPAPKHHLNLFWSNVYLGIHWRQNYLQATNMDETE